MLIVNFVNPPDLYEQTRDKFLRAFELGGQVDVQWGSYEYFVLVDMLLKKTIDRSHVVGVVVYDEETVFSGYTFEFDERGYPKHSPYLSSPTTDLARQIIKQRGF